MGRFRCAERSDFVFTFSLFFFLFFFLTVLYVYDRVIFSSAQKWPRHTLG